MYFDYNLFSPAFCRHFKHKLGIMPKTKTIHSTGGKVGILSRIVLNSKLCLSIQKLSWTTPIYSLCQITTRMFMKATQNKYRKRSLNKCRGRPVIHLGLRVRRLQREKGSSSKIDYAKYMEELAWQGELTLAQEMAKFEADKARDEANARSIFMRFC